MRDTFSSFLKAIRRGERYDESRTSVLSVRVVNGHVQATVRVDCPPEAKIHVVLRFPITGPIDVWAAARDEALKYLDIA